MHVCVVQATGEPPVRTVSIVIRQILYTAKSDQIRKQNSICVFQFVQWDIMGNSVLKCVSTVPTTPHATTGTVAVNVCLVGLLLIAPYVSAT